MENNIDKIFKNKLSSLQEKPSHEAWAKLEEAMYGKQIKRRSLAVYWQVAAAVATLLIASFSYFVANQEDTLAVEIKDKNQQPKEIQIPKQTQVATVETYQPIQNTATQTQVLEKQEFEKQVVKKEKVTLTDKEEVPLAKVENLYLAEVTPTHEAEKTLTLTDASLTESVDKETAVVKEEDIKITVKFVTQEQEEEEQAESTEEKKTWLGKMVSNIKKKRQREHAKEDENTEKESKEKEKSGVFVFGIDTEKIFAKKKAGE